MTRYRAAIHRQAYRETWRHHVVDAGKIVAQAFALLLMFAAIIYALPVYGAWLAGVFR